MGLVITLSGLHGTGKTTYAKPLSQIFNLRHISAGILFRQIAEECTLKMQASKQES